MTRVTRRLHRSGKRGKSDIWRVAKVTTGPLRGSDISDRKIIARSTTEL